MLIDDYPHLLHGGDYNPDQWSRLHRNIIDEDFILMEQAGCNAFSVGIFAWHALEPKESVYEFDWLDDIMERMAKAGNAVLLATPGAGNPNWLAEKYPETRAVDPQGRRQPPGKRANHCPSSSIFREKLAALSEKLAERYHDHPALGAWHISK